METAMPKSLYSSLECPDTFADRLEAHRLGVSVTATLSLLAAMTLGHLVGSADHRSNEPRALVVDAPRAMPGSRPVESSPKAGAIDAREHARAGWTSNLRAFRQDGVSDLTAGRLTRSDAPHRE